MKKWPANWTNVAFLLVFEFCMPKDYERLLAYQNHDQPSSNGVTASIKQEPSEEVMEEEVVDTQERQIVLNISNDLLDKSNAMASSTIKKPASSVLSSATKSLFKKIGNRKFVHVKSNSHYAL